MDVSRIDVTIDRVVLRGIDAADRHGLVDGLKRELAHALARPAATAPPLASRQTPLLRAGPLPLAPGPSGARRLGGGIAQAIAKGIRP
jgi:hypothetical protein